MEYLQNRGDVSFPRVLPPRRGRVSMAMGIVMERHDVDEAEAFRYLIQISQRRGCRVQDAAEEVIGQRSSSTAFEVIWIDDARSDLAAQS